MGLHDLKTVWQASLMATHLCQGQIMKYIKPPQKRKHNRMNCSQIRGRSHDSNFKMAANPIMVLPEIPWI